jgi:hypothetical protein
MSLPSDPSVTFGSTGGAYSTHTLTNGTPQTFTVDFSSSTLGGFVQIISTAGSSVSTTNGCQVQAFATADNSTYDTIAFAGVNFTIPQTASTATTESFLLPTGKYKIQLSNLDATYTITVEANSATLS